MSDPDPSKNLRQPDTGFRIQWNVPVNVIALVDSSFDRLLWHFLKISNILKIIRVGSRRGGGVPLTPAQPLDPPRGVGRQHIVTYWDSYIYRYLFV